MLEATIFLGVLHESDVEWLVTNSKEHDVAPGTVLIRCGEPVEFLYLVVDGALDVTVFSPDARHIATLYAGELAGEMSFVDLQPPSATVTAGMRSKILAIAKSALTEKITDDPEFGSRFYKGISVLLAGRLRAAYSIGARRRTDAESKVEVSVLEKRYAEIQHRLALRDSKKTSHAR